MTRTYLFLAAILTAMLMTAGCPATLEGGSFTMDDDDDDATGDDDTAGDDDTTGDDDTGDDDTGEEPVITLTATYMDTCAIQTDHTVKCWGMNSYNLPGEYQQVELSAATVCGLHLDGTIECTGYNADGQADPPEGTFIDMDMKGTFGCALRASDGTAVCWGRTDIVGNPPPGSFTDIAVTGAKACATNTLGEVTCWGAGDTTPSSSLLGQMTGEMYHFCGLTTSDGMSCWGAEIAYSTGQEGTWDGPYESVVAGQGLSCGLTPTGYLDCYGTPDHPVYFEQPPESLDEVVLGSLHACGITESDGSVVCWGDNNFDQLEVPTLH